MLSIKFIVLCSNKWIDISVPCRGTTFLNRALHSALRLRLVSVPCRGTAFLNTIPAIPPPVWAHGRDCVGKIFFEK